MLRLLIKDITVEKLVDAKQLLAHIRWQGGACSDVSVQLPLNMPDRTRYPSTVVAKIRDLARHLPDREIAGQINREGQTSAKRIPSRPRCSIGSVGVIRFHLRNSRDRRN